MADELHTPNHRWYEPRNHIALAKEDVSKQWIFNSGIQKINAWINSQPWGNPIAALFANNEPGVCYDPSDLSTLFQDTAGTTPVTTPGQTVALMLDKSKGLTLGPELVTNGGFDTADGWSLPAGSQISDGVLSVSTAVAGEIVSQAVEITAGKTYQITYTVISTNGQILVPRLSANSASSAPPTTTTGTFTALVLAVSNTDRFAFNVGGAGITCTIDNISVKELPGFHATQPTAAARPTYGIVPAGGRRNLLTFTEQFDNAAWTETALSLTLLSGQPASDGSLTATRVTPSASASGNARLRQNVSLPSGGVMTWRVKPDGLTFFNPTFNNSATLSASINLVTGAVTGVASGITEATAEFVDNGFVEVKLKTDTAVSWVEVYLKASAGFNNESYNGTDSMVISWPYVSTVEGGYQRVSTAFDVTEAGVESLGYLFFDGIDDWMVTPTITPGTDKVQVFAGVRKLSDAAYNSILESSTDPGANNGTIAIGTSALLGGDRATWNFQSRGTVNNFGVARPFAAPFTAVQTLLADTAQPTKETQILGRLNGADQSLIFTSTTLIGAGNYLAYPMYIGSRGGTFVHFNGHLYSLVTRFGANLDTSVIESTEAYVAGKTAGVDL